uniref:Uncharacterized protein n=1 Tax=Setaria digitata TaxID=48799 RepID=A0A915PRI0_9BILA
MDSDSKSYQKDQSLTTSLSSTHETELDFEPVVISGLPDTAPSPAVPFTTTPHTIAVREVYDVTAPSPSSSSDGSSNEFVKVEHSDFHQSDGSVGDTLSFKMEQLLQLHKDDKNNQEREKDQNPVLLILGQGLCISCLENLSEIYPPALRTDQHQQGRTRGDREKADPLGADLFCSRDKEQFGRERLLASCNVSLLEQYCFQSCLSGGTER